MDNLCGKFDDCFYHADKQTHTITDADERFTPVTLVDMDNE